MALYHGITEHKNQIADTISDVIEVLKPWLDKDLFLSMKEKKDNTRINSEFRNA